LRLPALPSGQQIALHRSEGEQQMHRFLILSAFVLGAAFIAPVVGRADDRNQQERRYYHRDARDYHTWNNNEDRAYRLYLQEQRREYREFNRVKRNQQGQYFRWRHDHPDNTLFKIEIR
jgi:type III secretory pathway component EscR